MTSRSLVNTVLPETAEYVCNLLGYEKFFPNSSGVEACEAAVKLARKWGYRIKGIPHNQADILLAQNCFWGRSITASGACTDPTRMADYGPFTPGFSFVEYNNVEAIQRHLENTPNCAAVMLESIQGEGGIVIPQEDYLAKVKALTVKHNCLLIVDEVQTGLGRTGKLMGYDHDMQKYNAKPDIVTIGKALSGGMTPICGIVADAEIMDAFLHNEHGSTFGGNPLSMAIAKASLKVLVEDNLIENSREMGNHMREKFSAMDSSMVGDVRGRGLMTALEINRDTNVNGHDFCDIMKGYGVLTKATKDYIVRFTPSLIITEKEIDEVSEIVEQSLHDLEKLNNSAVKIKLGDAT